MKLVRKEYDDEGSYVPPDNFKFRETPEDMAARQVQEARDYLKKIRSGKNLRFPWPDLDRICGAMLPGWLVGVGGRAKAGKTTFMRDCLTAWTEIGKKVVYVGTETEAASLRLAWAATRCNLPVSDVMDPTSSEAAMEKIDRDLGRQEGLAYQAIIGEIGEGTLADLLYWVEYARIGSADVLIFDHLHRLDVGPGEQWQGYGNAVRKLKNAARDAQLLVIMGAQLKDGDGGHVIGEYEIPGPGSWAATANIQREIDLGIQLWKPLKQGVSSEQKRMAREDMSKVQELVQLNVMGVRLAAHRWKSNAGNPCIRLYVQNDQISSWSNRA